RHRDLVVAGRGFQPVHARFGPGHAELAVGAGGGLDLVLRVAVAGAAAHDLDVDAGRRLAVDLEAERRLLTGVQVVGMGHRYQLQAQSVGLERGAAGRAPGDESLHAADRLADLQAVRVRRHFGEGRGGATPAPGLAILLPARDDRMAGHADAVGAFLLELHVEHAAVFAGRAVVDLDRAAVGRDD